MKITRRFDSLERVEIHQKSQRCLWSTQGQPGLSYLVDQRRISEATIRSFQLGYLPASLNHQLADRIIFPIFDASRNLIAISSRRIDDSKESLLPVYWHEAYEKSFYLYGIEQAIPSMRKWRFVILVEGQFDVLQLHNHGFINAVGLCSTNLSDMQMATIYRYCEEIVLILDKDKDSNQAGQKGTKKALERFGAYQFHSSPVYRDKMTFVEFDEETDPDRFLIDHGASVLWSMIRLKVQELRRAK